ncbi:MAG: tetratricopeptide repeat protein [Phycisphaerae bacterium]|nr:tetratricopeptide repeat protein [Phycisphaerae bacterium]MDD5380312.1 tetratricopeptide repeat protein [Phycisphaerae bacterium]
MKQERNKLYAILICVVLVLTTVIAYEQVRYNDFVGYDDYSYVTENPNVTGGITSESIRWAFTTPYAYNWHPLTWLSHMLDCRLFGLNPTGHHIINLLFHIANTLLLFWVLKRMTGAIWQSAFVAAVFALHPLHVESVAWAAERKDVLSSFFWMLTMIAYVRYAEQPSIKRYLPVVLAFSLGLLSKPMVVTLPFVLLLLDWWPLGRGKWGRLIAEKIPLFALAAVSSLVTYIVQQRTGAMAGADLLPVTIRTTNALVSYINYIGKMIYPSGLAVFYPHPLKLQIWQPIVSAVMLTVISTIVIYMGRRRRYLAVGWLWYLGTLVPVVGLVQVGLQAMADRYTYLPLIGIFIMVSWGAAELTAKWRYRNAVLGITASVILVAMLICTRTQMHYWQNSLTLFGRALEVTEDNQVMQTNYGNALLEKGQFEESITHLKEALKLRPEDFEARYNLGLAFLNLGKIDEAIVCFTESLKTSDKVYKVHSDLGLAYAEKGNLDMAIGHYKEALRLQPDYVKAINNLGSALKKQGKIDEAIKQWERALQLQPDFANPHYNLGVAMAEQGKYDDAVNHLKEALRIRPGWAEAHYELGGVYIRQGKRKQAAEQFAEALRLDPNYVEARVSLARILLEAGQVLPAIGHYYKILQLEPDNIDALNNLGWFLATTKDTSIANSAEAIKLAQHACELTKYEQAELLDTLAAAYASAGKFNEAAETAEKAVKSAEAGGKKELADEIQKRLELYKAGQPYQQK